MGRPISAYPRRNNSLAAKIVPFLSVSLSPQDQRALDHEAHGNPVLADLLLFRCTFGPDRQHKYEPLLEHLTYNDRSF